MGHDLHADPELGPARTLTSACRSPAVAAIGVARVLATRGTISSHAAGNDGRRARSPSSARSSGSRPHPACCCSPGLPAAASALPLLRRARRSHRRNRATPQLEPSLRGANPAKAAALDRYEEGRSPRRRGRGWTSASTRATSPASTGSRARTGIRRRSSLAGTRVAPGARSTATSSTRSGTGVTSS